MRSVCRPALAVGKNRPAFVIPPATTDLQIARGKPFPGEPARSDQGDGGSVPGLDVRFESMQPEFLEGVPHDVREPLFHQTLPRTAGERVVTEVPTQEHAAHDLRQCDEADEHTGITAANRETEIRRSTQVLEHLAKSGRG